MLMGLSLSIGVKMSKPKTGVFYVYSDSGKLGNVNITTNEKLANAIAVSDNDKWVAVYSKSTFELVGHLSTGWEMLDSKRVRGLHFFEAEGQ